VGGSEEGSVEGSVCWVSIEGSVVGVTGKPTVQLLSTVVQSIITAKANAADLIHCFIPIPTLF